MWNARWIRRVLAAAIAGTVALVCGTGCLMSDKFCQGTVQTCSYSSTCTPGSGKYGCRTGPTCASICETEYQANQQCTYHRQCRGILNVDGCQALNDTCSSLSEAQCKSDLDCDWDPDPTHCYGIPTVTDCMALSNAECAKVPGCSVQSP